MNIGTMMYLAPECIDDGLVSNEKNSSSLAKKIDVYAFSIIMWEILFETIPFIESPVSNSIRRDIPTIKIPYLVTKGERPTILQNSDEISQWVQQHGLETYRNIHSFIENYQRLLTNCWLQSPLKRPTFTEILNSIEDLRKLLQE